MNTWSTTFISVLCGRGGGRTTPNADEEVGPRGLIGKSGRVETDKIFGRTKGWGSPDDLETAIFDEEGEAQWCEGFFTKLTIYDLARMNPAAFCLSLGRNGVSAYDTQFFTFCLYHAQH